MENLFDLSAFGSHYKGYFVDKDGKVYSNKSGSMRALKVSAPANTMHKYWNLSHNSYSNSIRTDRFADMLSKSAEYRSFTKDSVMTSAGKGFIVGSVTAGGVSFSSNPKIHATESSARTECERLASANKGKTFMYVEIKGSVKASGYSWS